MPLDGVDNRQYKSFVKRRQQDGHSYSSCLNTLVSVYGYMPLQYSISRADPVLFGDDESKEFRKIAW